MNLFVTEAVDSPDVQAARELFVEYAAALGIDLCFQGFEEELRSLPGKYAPPSGRILLARADNELAGCVALRYLDNGIGEMKRLYVRPGFRSLGLGRRLAEAVIAAARRIGYRALRLDTLASMTAARRLYRELGFRPIEPYGYHPVEGTQFLELTLE